MANLVTLALFSLWIFVFLDKINCDDERIKGEDDNFLKSNAAFHNLPAATVNTAKRERRNANNGYIESQRIDIVESHNNYRSNVYPKAANMEYMSWDYALENMAQEWSENCNFAHGNPENTSPFSSIGQNIYLVDGQSSDTQPDSSSPVNVWYNEISDYNYDDNSCTESKECGHYTQIIWASTRSVGCGIAFCPTANSSDSLTFNNAWIVTCNYGPAGNTVNQLPYVEGEPCTKCDSGIGQCYTNLCRSCSDHDEECECKQVCRNCGQRDEDKCTCTCMAGWYGDDCSTECLDTHVLCGQNPGWYDASTCPLSATIPENCPLMCGVCEEAGGVTCGDDYEPGCESEYCANGGTLTSTCDCDCTDEYQGDQCLHPKWQAKHGVRIQIHASIQMYASLESNLLEAIVAVLDSYCNTNFEKCCPNSGNKRSSSALSYVTTNECETGVGYPTEIAEADYWTMVLVRYKTNNDLCNDGSARKKRNVFGQLILERKKRAEEDLHMDQDILYNAIIEGEETIESSIGTSVSNIEKAKVEIISTETSILWVVAVVVILLLILLIVGFCLYLYCTRPEDMVTLWTQLKITLIYSFTCKCCKACGKSTSIKNVNENVFTNSQSLEEQPNGRDFIIREHTVSTVANVSYVGNNNESVTIRSNETVTKTKKIIDSNMAAPRAETNKDEQEKPKRPKSSARKKTKKRITNRISSNSLQPLKPHYSSPLETPLETPGLPGTPAGDDVVPINYFGPEKIAKNTRPSNLPPLRMQSIAKLPPLSKPT